MEMKLLDVGCDPRPRGDINVNLFNEGFNPQTDDQFSKVKLMRPAECGNIIVADPMHLPFKDEAFSVTFSAHTIERVKNPLLMLQEMYRVANKKVIVRFFVKKDNDAGMHYDVDSPNEVWFKKADELSRGRRLLIISYNYPITSRLENICPAKIKKTILWRALKRFERAKIMTEFKIPFEMELWIKKKHSLDRSGNVKFVVIYNEPQIFKNCFCSSPYISHKSVIAYYNVSNEPLPRIFNQIIQEHFHEDCWFAFCHQDFILKEDLQPRLKGKDVEAIYGPIGAHVARNELSGMVMQADGTQIGSELKEDTPVQTLDEMCLLVHSEVFKQGLTFDEKFQLHFYGADLCMQAYITGFDVLAMQVRCQHKSRTLKGDIASQEYVSSLRLFRKKWEQHLPIRTTTKLVT